MALATGIRLGPYEILAKIGEGGMGEVYRARDTRLGRDVAIKVLPADLADGPDPSSGSSGSPRPGSGSSRGRARVDRLRRFELEARAVAALSHPNIVALYDVGTHDGTSYLVSELLEGETLADALRGGALSVAKAVEVGIQMAKGLAAAHARSIVHRDLKPSNVFLTHDGQVKLLDFGIAKKVTAGTGDDNAPTATAHGRDRGRDAPGHDGLHVARAGARPAVRSPCGHVRVRVRAVRDAVGAARVQGGDGRRHDVGDSQGGPAAAQRSSPVRVAGAAADRRPVPGEAA